MRDDYATMDEEGLRAEARQHLGACDAGDLDPDDLSWRLVADLPLATFEHLMTDASCSGPGTPPRDAWATWFHRECDMVAEELDGARCWDELAEQEIRDPVVVTIEPDRVQIWDGWHRIAGSFTAGRPTIPAIVGTVREAAVRHTPTGDSSWTPSASTR